MLNLAQTESQVKRAARQAAINPNNLLGMSAAYRQLKNLGWRCVDQEIHPVDRVPVFRLNGATIRRNRHTGIGWIVDCGGVETETNDHPADITAGLETDQRRARLDELRADVPAIAAEVEALIENAEALRLEMYDIEGITKRAIKAAFIIRDGKLLPPQPDEGISWAPEVARCQGSRSQPYRIYHFDGEYHCTCPDRAPVLPSGQQACKHILALMLAEAADESPLIDGEPLF